MQNGDLGRRYYLLSHRFKHDDSMFDCYALRLKFKSIKTLYYVKKLNK